MKRNASSGRLRPLILSKRRLERFFAIWRLSGRLDLALLAARFRCQEVVESFLLSGGHITTSSVEYRNLRLPVEPFRGPGLGGVAYMRRLVDFGATISAAGGADFAINLPDGCVFEASSSGLVDSMLMLVERFVDEEYAWLEPTGRIVVDVGTNIADSVIYFVGRGALHVYGYEPDPVAFSAALRNVARNNIQNVTLVPAAVTHVASPGDDHSARFVDLLRKVSLNHPGIAIVCKIDCEGCEYEIVNSSADLARAFGPVVQVMIEYHHRGSVSLKADLEGLGFQVDAAETVGGVGWVRARKAGPPPQ